MPDFLVAGVDSAGVRWMLVELETPQSRVTLAKKNDLDKHARAGVAQVLEWREWLQTTLTTPADPWPRDDQFWERQANWCLGRRWKSFLGLTHYCRTRRDGRFGLGRKPVAKRMRRTLKAIKAELRRRMHDKP